MESHGTDLHGTDLHGTDLHGMELHAIGLYAGHDGEFIIDRPKGSGDYLFLIFKTDAWIDLTEAGGPGPVLVHPNSCILFRLGTRQLYYAAGNPYVDHYVHFGADDSLVSATGIPLDVPFYLKNVLELEHILELLSAEQVASSHHRLENIELLLRLLLCKAEDNRTGEAVTTETTRRVESLRKLRSEIYSNAGRYHSVSDMAGRLNLSLSYFKSIYRQEFGISCYDDLLTAKFLTAQYYLSGSDLSIREIAALCGYENDTSFMRSFRTRTGLTPSDYRRKHPIS